LSISAYAGKRDQRGRKLMTTLHSRAALVVLDAATNQWPRHRYVHHHLAIVPNSLPDTRPMSINVDIEMDFDDSALLGMGTNPAAPLETRLVISLKSREDGKKLKAMVDRALAADPFFLALRDGQKVITAFALESN
jgi:hypothetical protein